MLSISVNKTALREIILNNKLYEIRLKRGIFKNIHIGQNITLFNESIKTNKKIEDILEFCNLEDLFNSIDYRFCTPLLDTKIDAINHINKFYKSNLLEKYNVIAIKLS